MSELHYLSATRAREMFVARELSPVELLDAVIARAEQVEPTVNAFCHRFYDRARDQAKAAEARYAGNGEPPRPLEGLPVALKDEESIAGEPLSLSSLMHKDDLGQTTTAVAERIMEAGGIIHARTTTPEFSCAGFTHSRLWGVTRNPWNPEFGVGGSSGGSAASLAAGTSMLASGSDIGGSIRIPASFNGVVGFKPPFGRVPVGPPFNLDQFCHCGPLARTVADAALFENVLAGPHPSDIVSLRPKLEIPAELEGIEGLRIGICLHQGDYPLDPEVEHNTLEAGAALAAAGARVEQFELGLTEQLINAATSVHFAAIFGDWIGHEADSAPDLVTAYAAEFARWTKERAGQTTMIEGMVTEAAVWAELAAAFERFDVILTPTVGTRGLVAGDDYVDHGLEVGGNQLEFYFQSMMTPLFNIASRCPVLNVPSGFAQNGVPTGLQIAARTYDDVTTFRVGAMLERERPWFDIAERRPSL
jgi:Asp-tRNA(Asn)/Glu-tRNA(Gln) amidotransferase A subunit family amidase